MRPEHWWFTTPLRLKSIFRRRRTESEMDEELQFHLDHKIEEGLAEKRPNPDDGRSYLLRTTERGGEIVQTIAPRIGENVKALGAISRRPLADIADALLALE